MKALVGLLALVLASCSPNILVVDENGAPIQGADVTPMSRSFSWPSKKTKKNGGAFIHQDIPRIESVRVSKMGYFPKPPVDYNLPKPITVVLQR